MIQGKSVKMDSELKRIIDKLYIIFADYKVGEKLDVCTKCCVTKKEENELVTTGVRNLPFELLYTYNVAGKSPNSNVSELKHFIPRYLELTANLEFVSHSAEIVLKRFKEITVWTENEKKLLNAFGEFFFRHCLNIHPLPENEIISVILIMLANGNFSIENNLRDWEKNGTIKSAQHFCDLINYGFNEKKPEQLSSGFADENTSQLIYNWINDIKTTTLFKKRIEEIIMNPIGLTDEKQTELSRAYEKLSNKNAL